MEGAYVTLGDRIEGLVHPADFQISPTRLLARFSSICGWMRWKVCARLVLDISSYAASSQKVEQVVAGPGVVKGSRLGIREHSEWLRLRQILSIFQIIDFQAM